METNTDKAVAGSSGASLLGVAYLVYELLFGTVGDLEEKVRILETQHALRCELQANSWNDQAALMRELAGIEGNTASRYVSLAEANGNLSDVDRLRMEEKLRRQAEYLQRAAAFAESANAVCSN